MLLRTPQYVVTYLKAALLCNSIVYMSYKLY